jgi:hypothetical protein
MEKESPEDKLLKACGLPAKTVQEQEDKKYFEAMLNQAKTASAWAQQAQDESDKAYRRLSTYIRDNLPADLVEAFEKVAQNEIRAKLYPLDSCVGNAADRINSCLQSLMEISWNGRLMWNAVLVGMATALIGGCMVRCTFFGDKIDEAKRYEIFGRKVEALIVRYKPKEQEKIYKWIGSRP